MGGGSSKKAPQSSELTAVVPAAAGGAAAPSKKAAAAACADGPERDCETPPQDDNSGSDNSQGLGETKEEEEACTLSELDKVFGKDGSRLTFGAEGVDSLLDPSMFSNGDMKLCVGGNGNDEMTNFEDFVFDTEAPQSGDSGGADAEGAFAALCEADACEKEIAQLEELMAEDAPAESCGSQGD